MAKVDINTKMITLLGDPLKQSFAAQMQNCGYEAAGLNMIYFYFRDASCSSIHQTHTALP